MRIANFAHDIDDEGYGRHETARLLIKEGLGEGIPPVDLPPSLTEAMRAYLQGNVTTPVTWVIEGVSWGGFRLADGAQINEIEIDLRRVAPCVVGPHDGNVWWSVYWPRYQAAQGAAALVQRLGLGR